MIGEGPWHVQMDAMPLQKGGIDLNLTISDDTVSPHNDICVLGKVKIGSYLREVATKERLSVVIAEKSQDNQRQGREQ